MFQSTENNKQNKDLLVTSVIGGVVALYASIALTTAANRTHLGVLELIGDMTFEKFIDWFNPVNMFKYATPDSLGSAAFAAFLIVAIICAAYISGRTYVGDMRGIEQGSAKWMLDVEEEEKKGKKFKEPKPATEYRKKMMDPEYTKNIMFDNTYGLSMDGRKTRKNLHMLVIGGSGAGKTRFFVKPNILQMNSSYIITDPSGELYRDMGQMLIDNNYDVRVFNTFDTNRSMQYNPLSYIRKEEDVTDLVTTLIKNTGEATGDNKYFDDATKLLLSAIILFLTTYCPKSEHDFAHVMQLVVAADVPEGTKNPQSDLDKIFEQVAEVDPYGLALKMYKSFKSTSGKSLKAVLSSTATRLTVFNYQKIENLTCADTISLTTIGDEKCALFIITPPIDNGFNFLVAMMYSQLFSSLYYHTTFECRYLLTDENYIARPFASKEEADMVAYLLAQQKAHPDKKILRYEMDDMTDKYDMKLSSDGEDFIKMFLEENKKKQAAADKNKEKVDKKQKEAEAKAEKEERAKRDKQRQERLIQDQENALSSAQDASMTDGVDSREAARVSQDASNDWNMLTNASDKDFEDRNKGQEDISGALLKAKENDVLMRELRKETVDRFQNDPAQFKVKQNSKEEAGSPFHVRMLMDEFANINEIPGFSEVLATVRKYNMSVVIILQSLSQLKKRYEKDYESIIDNCDTFVFLGSKGQETTEYVSKMLGEKTIKVQGNNQSYGKGNSRGVNISVQKRALMTPNELVMLDTDLQVVILKSVNPFKLHKFALEKHPNFDQSADGKGKKLDINKVNLAEKMRKYNEKHGIKKDEGEETQEEINARASQPVSGWMNNDGVTLTKDGKKANSSVDEFNFF